MDKSLLKSQHISHSVSFIFSLRFKHAYVRKPSSSRPWTFWFAQLASWIFELCVLPPAGAQSLAVQGKAGIAAFRKRYTGEWADISSESL